MNEIMIMNDVMEWLWSMSWLALIALTHSPLATTQPVPGNLLSIIAHIIDQSVRNCPKLMVSIIDLTRLLSLLTRQIKQQSALNHKL